MRASVALALCGASLCGLAACGAGVNETAATITYNVPYVGEATLIPIDPRADYAPIALRATLTPSQLASTVTGTLDVVTTALATPDTVLAAGFTARVTPDGLDATVVQPLGCATHLSGPLTLGPNDELSGALTGSDCHATGSDNLRLTLVLTRQ